MQGRFTLALKDRYGTYHVRDSLSNTDEPYDQPFAMTVSGKKFYVLTNEKDATATFQNTTTISQDKHTRDLMLKFGVGPSGMKKIWSDFKVENSKRPDEKKLQPKSLVYRSEELCCKQLSPGAKLDDFTDTLCSVLAKSLRHEDLPRRHVDWKDGSTVTLMDFCADAALTTMARSLFGDLIYDITPDLSQCLYDYNEEAWKTLLIQYPTFAARKLHRAKHKILTTLYEFLKSPMEQRYGQSELIKALLEEQEFAGLDYKDRAALTSMFLAL